MNDLTVELFRQVAKTQKDSGFEEPPEVQQSVINRYLALPGLRGFWPMSSVDYTAANRGIDLSGQGNHLTANNSPTFGYDGLAPYVQFDGANQYMSRADGGAANWADIQGNETYIIAADRGLTIYGWFYFDNVAGANEYMVSKWGIAANRSYLIRRAGGGGIDFIISTDGTNIAVILNGDTPSEQTWFFCAVRFVPSTECSIFINSTKITTAVGVPATIWDGGEQLSLGIYAPTLANDMTGRQSMIALCAEQHDDAIILSLYEQTRALYGV